MEIKQIKGEQLLHTMDVLLPVVATPTKSLFIQCKEHWTVLFENGHFGTDPGHIFALGERLGVTTMRVVAVPDNVSYGAYGATIWQVNDSDGNMRRSIYAMNDGGRWEFYSRGKAFGFERVENYSAKRIRDRFTKDMLEEYLADSGLFPFDDTWFVADQAVLVERVGGYKAPTHRVEDAIH